MEKIIYIADLDQDIDDLIAIDYLNSQNVLGGVVLDPYPREKKGFFRINLLKEMGIEVFKEIPLGTKNIFIGGALGKVAKYVKDEKIENLVMNGGFVGENIVKRPLPKFRGKEVCRTYNFNCNVEAANEVLKSSNIEKIILVGKNVCHDKKNTPIGIWRDFSELFKKYNVNDTKLQHDLLACREGLVKLNYLDEESFLEYMELFPYNLGLNGNMTLWGTSREDKCGYRKVIVAVDWKI